jgi:uncharacterized membrane protein
VNKARLEAFSDGVLAVAITLLVLDLHATRTSPLSLADQLRAEWPTFAAYVVSFFIIGVVWINHHAIFRVATAVDHRILVYNLLLLMFVAAIPFCTATYAEFVRAGGMNAKVAVLAYGIVMEGMAVSFALILGRLQKAGLTIAGSVPRDRQLSLQNAMGYVIFPLITLIGWFYPHVMLVLYAIVVGYYFGPAPRSLYVLDSPVEPAR